MQETASGSPAAAATAAPAPPPLPAARRVTAVTVTHDSAGEIGGFLAALPPGMAAVVVDNASADGTAERAEAWAGAARVVRSGRNLGFGAGCNLGLALVETEFALLANPDARPSAEATTALVAAADAFPDAALLAPLILDAAGRPARSWDAEQSRRRRLPRRRDAEPWPEGPVCVEHASGACLLLRRADGLRFDEGFFLYYEDDDLCAEARARGRSVVLVPAAVVRHAGGASSAPSAAVAWRKARHMAWSRLRYAAKRGGDAGAGAARREARARLLHHAAKALGHAATLRGRRAWADLAGLAGTLAWMRGRR